MPAVIRPIDPAKRIDINVSPLSPHVVVYRLWWRDKNSTWAPLGTGTTADQVSDHYQQTWTEGAQLFYWIGVGGNARTPYSALIAFSQDGHTLPGGNVGIDGMTNASGEDIKEDWVDLIA